MYILTLGFILLIIFSALITEYLYRKKIVHPEIARKILHVVSASLAALSVYFIDFEILLFVGGSACLITYLLVNRNIFLPIHSGRNKSWGIFYLPLAFTLLVLLFGPDNKWALFLSLLILAISDSAAAIIGTFFSKKYYSLTGDKKSYLGSAVFFFSTVFIMWIFSAKILLMIEAVDWIQTPALYYWISVFIIALILTLFEAISSKGFDNFSVPLVGAVLFLIFFEKPGAALLINFLVGLSLASIVALLSHKAKFLTADGSIATFLLAGFIFGLGGWKWSTPIMTFFILSSLLSKVRKRTNKEVDIYFEKTGTRDAFQVSANGGLGGVLVIINQLYPAEIFYLIYVASLAAVCADTWATEIGTLRKTNTYNILNMKHAEQGTSGGISLFGTFGAIAGASAIAGSAIWWFDNHIFLSVGMIILAGVFGSFFDSFLGATIQSQNKCYVCNKITERYLHCGKKADHVRGFKWLNNDVVNLLSGISGGVIILIIYGF